MNGSIFSRPMATSSGGNGCLGRDIGDGSLIARVTGINSPIDDAFFPADSAVLAGNDTVTSGSGNDYLLGYGGDDTVSGRARRCFPGGWAGKDTLNGGRCWYGAFQFAAERLHGARCARWPRRGRVRPEGWRCAGRAVRH